MRATLLLASYLALCPLAAQGQADAPTSDPPAVGAPSPAPAVETPPADGPPAAAPAPPVATPAPAEPSPPVAPAQPATQPGTQLEPPPSAVAPPPVAPSSWPPPATAAPPPVAAPSAAPGRAPMMAPFTPMPSPLLPGSVWPPPGYVPPSSAVPPASMGSYGTRTLMAQPGLITVPALPPDYVYVPMPRGQASTVPSPQQVAQRAQLEEELRRTEQRLIALEQSRVSVAGPIVLMVLGYGTTIISAAVALGSFGLAEEIEHGRGLADARLDLNDDGRVDGRDEESFRRTARIASVVSAAGLLLGIGGTGRLIHKVGMRREQAVQVKVLEEQRRYTRARLGYGASPLPQGGMQLGLNGSF